MARCRRCCNGWARPTARPRSSPRATRCAASSRSIASPKRCADDQQRLGSGRGAPTMRLDMRHTIIAIVLLFAGSAHARSVFVDVPEVEVDRLVELELRNAGYEVVATKAA